MDWIFPIELPSFKLWEGFHIRDLVAANTYSVWEPVYDRSTQAFVGLGRPLKPQADLFPSEQKKKS